ncbi:MAG TPA: bifunctional UDP-sugar hydrolase/5'-nucleotidase [Polyangia bacterium]
MRRALTLVCLFFACGMARAEPAPKSWWLELIGTTDRHGELKQAALLGGYLAVLRREHPGKTLLLDGGDLFTGTLVADLGEGAAIIRAMNALGYDAAAVGNHDFDFGPVGPRAVPKDLSDDPRGAIEARAKQAHFPLLTANIVKSDGGPLGWARPFAMVKLAGEKIAVVGGTTAATPETTMHPNLVGLDVLPLAPKIAEATRRARSLGAKVVIAVVHAGGACPPRTVTLTREAPGDLEGCVADSELFQLAHALAKGDPASRPDAIFGGHTHHALTAVIGGIPLSQADPRGTAFSVIALEIDGTTGRPTGAFRLEPPTILKSGDRFHGAPIAPDPKVAAAIAPDFSRAAARRAAPVGVILDGKLWRSYDTESPMGNLFADLVRLATSADIGLINGGGLRADLPAGPLSYGALFAALPFANRLATLRLSGAALKRLFAANFAGDHGLLSIGGATVSGRCEKGQVAVTITLASGRTVGDRDQVRVGTSDFLALGGDDFAKVLTPGAARIDENGPTQRDAIAAALGRLAELRPDDPRFFDPKHPRIRLAAPRPLTCR